MQKLLTAAETAAWLGLKAPTLTNWRYRGIGPRFVKVGGRVMYAETDVSAWITAQTFSTNEEAARA